jgi:hypothetical protein
LDSMTSSFNILSISSSATFLWCIGERLDGNLIGFVLSVLICLCAQAHLSVLQIRQSIQQASLIAVRAHVTSNSLTLFQEEVTNAPVRLTNSKIHFLFSPIQYNTVLHRVEGL